MTDKKVDKFLENNDFVDENHLPPLPKSLWNFSAPTAAAAAPISYPPIPVVQYNTTLPLFPFSYEQVRQIQRDAILAERKRQQAKIRFHLERTTMSVYGTQLECKAARDSLQRLLDDNT